MNRLAELFRREGPWAILAIRRLAVNRLGLVAIRRLTRVPDVYFQGPPRIIGMRFVRFGRNFQCGCGAWIEAVQTPGEQPCQPKIVIGDNVVVSEHFHVAAVDRVSIGDGVLIGSGVLVTDHTHGRYGRTQGDTPTTPPVHRALSSKGPVTIGRNVWIADGVKILSGVTIGDGCIIGANTVVAEDVPPNSIYASGGPGRIVKQFDTDRQQWQPPLD